MDKNWDSLNSKFQINVIGSNKEFKLGNEYGCMMIWYYIKRHIKPITRVIVAELYGYIESTRLTNFGDNIVKFNTWLEDTRKAIIDEEGKFYNEYIVQLFQA